MIVSELASSRVGEFAGRTDDELAGVPTSCEQASRARVRGLDVDGVVCTGKSTSRRPRAHVREGADGGERMLCTWREACKAADYVLEHFGDRCRDRGIWVWYCRRIGLDAFLNIADEVISCTRQGELRWPTRALQRHLQEALPRGLPSVARSAKGSSFASLPRGLPSVARSAKEGGAA